MPKAVIEEAKTEREQAEGKRGATLLEQAQALLDKARELLTKAEATGDIQTALRGVREARECLNFIAKLSGEIDESVNIIVNPQFVTVQAVIVAALAPFADARRAVIDALGTHRGEA